MTTGPLGPYYHVGIVVPDLAEAQAELTGQLGITWGPVLQLDATDCGTGRVETSCSRQRSATR